MNKQELELYKKLGKEFGKQGGLTTLKRHGKKHFIEAGKKGALKRWKDHKPIKENIGASKITLDK